MNNPISTYRLQFHKDFTFSDLEKIIPYLKDLGVKTIYASPIFKAVPGSVHGYDGTDPQLINPEIGTLEQLRRISTTLRKDGIGWLQDIVPNHMAYHQDNKWLMDVLEKGEKSGYAKFFDIEWHGETYPGHVMAPFLGDDIKKVIADGQIKLAFDDQTKKLVLHYYDAVYPVNDRTYMAVLEHCDQDEFIEQIQQLEHIQEAATYDVLWREYCERFAELMRTAESGAAMKRQIERINKDNEALLNIAQQQHYKLCHWQETDSHINYRRFFTINGLICLNIQHEEVFEQVHQLAKKLTKDNIFDGLRVDHIDGLHDPKTYLQRLRKLAGEKKYIVTEKILETKEYMPDDWPIEGNTGYDFLAMVNNLLTNQQSEKQFTSYYDQLTPGAAALQQQIADKKALILFRHMAGELDNLSALFHDIERTDQCGSSDVKKAIAAMLIACPVYRYYGNEFPLPIKEKQSLQKIFGRVKAEQPAIVAAVNIVEKVLLADAPNEKALRFYQRCMQFTGPLMAKGVEDTLMYTYNRFVAHNEVGDSAETFGLSVQQFHNEMILRAEKWPYSLNATATHDTKRGEDVRARLNVLTDIAEEWVQTVGEWSKRNSKLKQKEMPDANDEYLIYQTLVGAYPYTKNEQSNFPERIKEYLQKALREAKTHSDWATPNDAYEEAACNFAMSLLDESKPFRKQLEQFVERIANHGIINSLVQTVLKFTCPGVPDTYQGCELWDLHLVDPDNRRPVDYDNRRQLLDQIENKTGSDRISELWQGRTSGKIKLWLTQQLMKLRQEHPELLSKGDYIPLAVTGVYQQNIIAFARRHAGRTCVVVLPLHIAAICNEHSCDWQNLDWKDTAVLLPEDTTIVKEVLTGTDITATGNKLLIKELFHYLPLAILK